MTKAAKKTKEVKVQAQKKEADISKYAELESTSAKIRAMTADGMSRSEVAKALNIRYQHVRNVLITPLKKTA